MDLIYQKKADVALITINRPKVLNALSTSLLNELYALLQNIQEKVVILTGAGEKAFIAGADIREMDGMTGEQWIDYCRLGRSTLSLLETGPFVSIAAVNGYAFGGGMEVALACDMVVASDNALMGMPEVKLGVIPSFSGIERLSKVVGKYRALEWMLTGKHFTAGQAQEMGLVNQVCPGDQLLPVCEALAGEVVKNSFSAMMGVKQVMRQAEMEESVSLNCFTKSDRKVRMDAFLMSKKHAE